MSGKRHTRDMKERSSLIASGLMKEAVLDGTEKGPRLLLVCKACRHAARYEVGTITMDVERLDSDGDSHDDLSGSPYGFIRYFRCKRCGASGPWSLPGKTRLKLQMMILGGLLRHDRSGVAALRIRLFDGTRVSTCAEGVDHLLGKIEADPDNPFLYDRLGNLYRTGGRSDLALDAYREALLRDPDFVLSLHSAGMLLTDGGELEMAAELFHRFLRSVRSEVADARIGIAELRALTRDVLEALLEIHTESGEKIPFLPDGEPERPVRGSNEPISLELLSFDLSSEEDWERLTDACLGHSVHKTVQQQARKSNKRRRKRRKRK